MLRLLSALFLVASPAVGQSDPHPSRPRWTTISRRSSGTKIFKHVTLRPDLAVNEEGEIAWAIRKESPQLTGCPDWYGHRTTLLAMTFLGGYDLEHQVDRFLDQRFAELRARLLTKHAGQTSPGGAAAR